MNTLNNNNGKKEISKKEISKKEISKKEIDFQNLTDEQILNMDLDGNNIYALLEQNKFVKQQLKQKEKSGGGNKTMYKRETVEKSGKTLKRFKSYARNKRNNFATNIIKLFLAKNETDLKAEIKAFNSFYKETYTLNDLTIDSVARANSDTTTKANVKLMFEIIKQTK